MYKIVIILYMVFFVINLISNGIDCMLSSIVIELVDEKILYKNVISNNINNKY